MCTVNILIERLKVGASFSLKISIIRRFEKKNFRRHQLRTVCFASLKKDCMVLLFMETLVLLFL
jgi:hypothetical protein